MIRLENISKTFTVGGRPVEALKNVSLNVEKGSIFGLMGPSGAGKSTLIRCMNLLEKPESGRVLVNDIDLTAASRRELRLCRRDIGMIFQQFCLFPSRTVLENVTFPLGPRPGKKGKERAMELLSLTGMSEKAGAYPHQLSGGQQQRVAIARALAFSPAILLCDEPTSALDPENSAMILSLIKKLAGELGITVVMVTHQTEAVREICTHAAIIENGRVTMHGRITEFLCECKAKPAPIDFRAFSPQRGVVANG